MKFLKICLVIICAVFIFSNYTSIKSYEVRHLINLLTKKSLSPSNFSLDVIEDGNAINDLDAIKDKINFKFLQSLKNPCWFDSRSQSEIKEAKRESHPGVLRCLPYFFIFGMRKSGTSDFYDYIKRHPDIISTRKEYHYWNLPKMKDKKNYTFGNYTQKFDEVATALENECQITKNHESNSLNCKQYITSDASPDYFWKDGTIMRKYHKRMIHSTFGKQLILDYAGRRLSKSVSKREIFNFTKDFLYSPFTVADLIKKVLPKSRLILLLRNPVDRLFSDYKFMRRGGKRKSLSPDDFHEKALKEIEIWHNCTKTHTLRYCSYAHPRARRAGVPLSIYVNYLKDWMAVFPREQLLVLRFEDYVRDKKTTLQNTFRFLGISDVTKEIISDDKKIKNKGFKIKPMLNTTRELLIKFYEPFNKELSDILQDNRFTWDDVNGQ